MKTIYTAIFGNYDPIKEPIVITPGWRYVCYTDQPFKSSTWETRYILTSTPINQARNIKMLGGYYPFEKSIYIDGSFKINCDLNEFWDKHFVSPMTVIQHPIRNCAYEEAAACQRNGRGDKEAIARQISKYEAEGLPRNNGLIQSGILLRENTKEVREFCNLWNEQIKLSTRDQIGFAFAEFKMGIKWPRITNFDYRTSREFIFHRHSKR